MLLHTKAKSPAAETEGKYIHISEIYPQILREKNVQHFALKKQQCISNAANYF